MSSSYNTLPSVDTTVPPQRKVAYDVQESGGGGRGFFCFLPCTTTTTNTIVSLAKHTWNHLPRLGLDGTLEVSLLSYNLFIRPPGIRNNQDDFKGERLEGFIKVIKDYDIIGLQEMFSTFSTRQQQLIDAARTIGFHYHVKPKPHGPLSPFLVDGGLLLLSKYPVVESDSMIFVQGVQSDGLASKGAIYARIQLEENATSCINVFVTHTQASYTSSNASLSSKSENVRAQQIRQLTQFIRDKLKTRSGPGVLLGDLNVNGRKTEDSSQEDSEEYLKMMNIFKESSPSGISLIPHDLLKEDFGGQPVTYGDIWDDDGSWHRARTGRIHHPSGKEPKEVILTHPEDLCTRQRLDYIIFFDPLRRSSNQVSRNDSHSSIDDEGDSDHSSSSTSSSSSSSSSSVSTASLKPTPMSVVPAASAATTSSSSSYPIDLPNGGYTSAGVSLPAEKRYFKVKSGTGVTKVEHFFVSNHPFTQLSDHYGVSTKIVYHRNGFTVS